MIYKKYGTYVFLAAGWLCALYKASLIKISFIVGSKALFFSGASVMGPLLGSCANIWICSAVLLGRMIIKMVITGSWAGTLFALHVPGWLAAISWVRPSLCTKVLVPLICMGLFMAHPVGGQVWFYTLYWLIPMGLYSGGYRSIFGQALSTTFIAHAVGSVMHLYTYAMAPGNWVLLMPIVPVERLLFASAMTIIYYAMAWSMHVIQVAMHRVRQLSLVSHKA